ncbi:hypothetical protein B5S28_g2890 [[Candida] boidinii]|nr:hypothetical protein B5S28_g2890 [[Candida] boidinii]
MSNNKRKIKINLPAFESEDEDEDEQKSIVSKGSINKTKINGIDTISNDHDGEDDLDIPIVKKKPILFKKIKREVADRLKESDISTTNNNFRTEPSYISEKFVSAEIKHETSDTDKNHAIPSISKLEKLSNIEASKFTDANEDKYTYVAFNEKSTLKNNIESDNRGGYSMEYDSENESDYHGNYSDLEDMPENESDEEERQADREWYTQDELSSHTFENYDEYEYEEYEHEKALEIQRKRRQDNKNDRRNKRNEDHRKFESSWFDDKLKTSGVSGSRYSGNDSDNDNDIETGSNIRILVHKLIPPFLDPESISSNKIEIISPVKDPTGDLFNYSKHGSTLVNDRRMKRERIKNSKEAANMEGTRLGNLTNKDNGKEGKENNDSGDDRDSHSKKFIDTLEQDSKEVQDQSNSKFSSQLTIQQQRKFLPVYSVRSELLKKINENQVVILVGETGSGKTTQIAQYLYEEGYHLKSGRSRDGSMIGVTQPRRVAAMSVAKRVSEEMSVRLGQEVGFSIRFEDCTSNKTKIKFMTDGILLRETLNDPELDNYSCIIIDEAHERSLNTDILLGLFKNILAVRKDLKLIITSATMNADKFSRFFGNAIQFTIPGKTFPVDIFFNKTPSTDYVESSIKQALRIHLQNQKKPGDILIFMTGQEDIECCCEILEERLSELIKENKNNDINIEPMEILPIYSTLPADLQAKIFKKNVKGNRKCIISTNIAETSLTVDGIMYVIDSGLCKLKVFNSKIGMDTLQITPISLAQANQRSGRAGRTGPGICYRLYTQGASIEEMFNEPIPEIQRSNLNNTILLLKSLDVDDITKFQFIDKPTIESISTSQYELWCLGALDNFGKLTKLGRLMSLFPIEPKLSKLLILSSLSNFRCSSEIVIIISMLSIPSVFVRSNSDLKQQENSDKAREKFLINESDHLTLLNIYKQYESSKFNDRWCIKNYLHPKSLRRARDIKDQLVIIMKKNELKLSSIGYDWDIIKKCICSSFLINAGELKKYGEYSNLRTGVSMKLHPTSSLFGLGDLPKYIVYHELVLTSKEYMNCVTSVEPEWLIEFGEVFYSEKVKGLSSKENQILKEQEFQKLIENEKLENQFKDAKNIGESSNKISSRFVSESDDKKIKRSTATASSSTGGLSKIELLKKRRRLGGL